MTYDQFIQTKVKVIKPSGFEPGPMCEGLYQWQKDVVAWAIRQGRCALFEECGLGKTVQQLEWATQVNEHTKKPVIILAPLGVVEQTIQEAARFGYPILHVESGDDVKNTVCITNYDKYQKFDMSIFSGVVLDEGSILKNFTGKMRIGLTAAFSQTPYRMSCTATPAPNDYMEFGQQCEFLGVMDSNEMLSRWFINDTMNFGCYRLKGHARADFWEWVSSWAACITKPSDIGYSDDGYVLQDVNMQHVIVQADLNEGKADDELFRNVEVNATSMHREMRITCDKRAQKAAEIMNGSNDFWVIWCNTNYEADALKKVIPDAVEVRGNESEKIKSEKLNGFTRGKFKRIITKPGIAGLGLNWQHCSNAVFVGLSYSFEELYQATKRIHRFGQKRPVNIWIIQGDTEHNIYQVVKRKIDQHHEMIGEMGKSAVNIINKKDKVLQMRTDFEAATGHNWKIYNGDCVRVMESLPENSIDLSIYSPPFSSLYIYSDDCQDMGNTETDEEFMQQYDFCIRELLRITKVGCISCVHCKNLVDYAGRDGHAGLRDFRGKIIEAHIKAGWVYHSEVVIWKDPVVEMQRTKCQGLLFKQLRQNSRFSRMGMPEYVVVFRKWGEGMGDNKVEHRFSKDPEDLGYVNGSTPQTWQRYASPVWFDIDQTNVLNYELAREKRDEKHICPLQLDVINRCLMLWSAKGDVVFSPFAGIGSEGVCSLRHGRKFIGAELKKAYWQQACSFLKNEGAQLNLDI